MNKTFIFCLLLFFSVAATGYCVDSYRVHLEVSVEHGTGKRTIRTSSDVVSGIPIAYLTSDYILSLAFSVEPPPSDSFLLTVSLLSIPQGINTPLIKQLAPDSFITLPAISTLDSNPSLLTQNFHSRLVGGEIGPFEFKSEQNDYKVTGVIALSLLR